MSRGTASQGSPPGALIDELMGLARRVAADSPNRVRKVGAALAMADGHTRIASCNTFPEGVRDLEERHAGDGRFVWMEHAERNAIFEAARSGQATRGATLATTFFPCIDCARAIVQAGITSLHTLAPDFGDPLWGSAFRFSKAILEEGGVRVSYLERDPQLMHAATLGR